MFTVQRLFPSILLLSGATLLGAQSPVKQPAAGYQTLTHQSETLRGLRALDVRVDLDGSIADKSAIVSQTELRLRQAGIKIPTQGFDRIAMYCNSKLVGTTGLAVLTCNLDYMDVVMRLLPVAQRFEATLWASQKTVTVGGNGLRQAFEATTSQLLDEFLNDWYKANQ